MRENTPRHDHSVAPPIETYQDVLNAYPDMHNGLRQHVERLAAHTETHIAAADEGYFLVHDGELDYVPEPLDKPTVPVSEQTPVVPLTSLTEKIRHSMTYARQAEERDVVHTFSPGADTDLRATLAQGDYTADELAAFIDEAFALAEVVRRQESLSLLKEAYKPPLSTYGSILHALTEAPSHKLKEIYFGRNDTLKIMLESVENPSDIDKALRVLQRAYQCDDVLTLNTLKHGDKTVAAVVDRPKAGSAMLMALLEEGTYWPEGTSPQEASLARRDWADRYLQQVTNMPAQLRSELLFNAFSRTSKEKAPEEVDPSALYTLLDTITEHTQKLGMARLMQLREKAGLVSFDYYRPEQLQLMSKLINGDRETIEKLKAGDVTVVFIDAKGDYNAAFSSMSENYWSENNRTLFFEINEARDFFRAWRLLKRHKIKPSTTVIGAHGNVGTLPFGRAEDVIHVVNDYPASDMEWPDNAKSLYDLTFIARIANRYMQNSRAIDENPAAIGRRRVILNSCQLGTPNYVRGPEKPSIQSKRMERKAHHELIDKQESVAQTLAQLIGSQRVDVFTADESFLVGRTKRGIILWRKKLDGQGEIVRDEEKEIVWEPFQPLRIRLRADGSILEERVKEIVLRRQSDAERIAA